MFHLWCHSDDYTIMNRIISITLKNVYNKFIIYSLKYCNQPTNIIIDINIEELTMNIIEQ